MVVGQGVSPPTVDRERGEPKVWLPGEGWVVVEPVQDAQEAGYAADSEDSVQRDNQGQSEKQTAPVAPSERPVHDMVRAACSRRLGSHVDDFCSGAGSRCETLLPCPAMVG